MASSAKVGFWGGLFGQTAASSDGDRFTLQELRRLHAVLTEERTVTGAYTADRSRKCENVVSEGGLHTNGTGYQPVYQVLAWNMYLPNGLQMATGSWWWRRCARWRSS